MPSFTFKKDKFKSTRGGYSRLLNICCRRCEAVVAVYQKDGPGNLRRMYLDRILAPEPWVGLHKHPLKEVPVLECSNCKELLGMPYIYQKEKRPAFRIFQDAVVKRLRKLKEE